MAHIIEMMLQRHKRILAIIQQKQDFSTEQLVAYIRSGKECALVIAGFKCQKCGEKEKLTYHHLISRIFKYYINNKIRYLSQRNYWANIIILCQKCHYQVHKENPVANDKLDNGKFISRKAIIKMKRKYGMLEESP